MVSDKLTYIESGAELLVTSLLALIR